MFTGGDAAAAAVATSSTPTNSSPSSSSHHFQQQLQPGRPATPRMLRSVSGSMKSSKTDLNNASQNYNENFPQYVAASSQYPNNQSHSRNSSLQHQIQQQQQQQFQQAAQRQVQQQQANITNNKVNHNNNQNRRIRSSTQKSELLPPASFTPPMPNDSATPSTVSANQGQTLHAQKQNQAHSGAHGHGNHHHHQQQQQQQQDQQQQFHRKSIGDWDFVKTIGAGSMGKVKLAQHNSTYELCAVKIVPRAAKLYQRAHADDPPITDAQIKAQKQKEFEKEVARDKRTIREGALGRLLFHPFICRLYEMVPMTNHYYMLFEYVEGGQMLDYIVSHGSLKEKAARRFARGIASALDYCHKNNVVHRDLKIENIMINQKGDIKIIDFGLSNLYSPKSVLKTYCGSLYFAAPELLSAKPYIGPEVDVWSFGVVLYVLVCGKVPFDDQEVAVLHEKIKRGDVEYPSFLTKECISILSRMLVVDPTKRATLYEIMQHPWLNKGYDFTVSNYVPKRIPLALPLDPEIIKTIASFDLGSVQSIANELTNILSSVEYQMSSENWYRITKQGRPYASASNAHLLPDPTGGFHPLVSIYYLVDEMKKRKKAKEEAIKAQLQQHAEHRQRRQQVQPQQPQQPQPQQPQSHPYQPQPMSEDPPTKVQQNVPELSFPEQAHTSSSPATFTRSSQSPPVQTAHTQQSEDETQKQESTLPEQQPHSPRDSGSPDTLDPNVAKGLGFNSLLRRLSSKKYKNSPTNSPTKNTTASPNDSDNNETFAPPPVPRVSVIKDSQDKITPQTSNNSNQQEIANSQNLNLDKKDPMVRRGVSMKVTAKEKQSGSRINLASNPPNRSEKANDRVNRGEELANKGHSRTSSASNNKFHGFIPVEYLPPLPNINTNNLDIPGGSGSHSISVSNSNEKQGLTESASGGRKLHPTARAKSVGGHVRKDSYHSRRGGYTGQSHPPLPNSLASQNSDDGISDNNNQREEVFFDDVSLDNIEHQEIPQLSEHEIIEQFNHAKHNTMPSIEYPKTLFLKGFFSVQTTSTKPLPVIRYNIINVLSKLGVKFQEVKGGFVCVHTPSLQNQSQQDTSAYSNDVSMASGTADEEEEREEEKKLYGDAFKSTSSSFYNEQREKQEVPTRTKTPDSTNDQANSSLSSGGQYTPHHQQSKSLSRQPSLHLNTHSLSPSGKPGGHRSSNSIGGGHRRKFSIGQSILNSYRKKNGSGVNMPPNTPATAKLSKLMYADEELDDQEVEEEDEARHQLTEDDSVDSLNNVMIGGGSDMLISSRIEHKAKHQHSPNTSMSQAGNPEGGAVSSTSRKSPLKFEIHIVKVPLVGLYGVQFKKVLGNTWNYKTLAGQVLKELNL
ncbi:Pkinase-domain-containing protein [Hyphopichia burtonii NRRL Y-1933]|uniref:non-specific serine/threonine protein kinase n=1 Tax=Hyphopichia burtonii NRRL Y-1933 TaxID=984485 RepID=A0A1E4RMS7_9ASCO|nr:Pkinase-domain-containing protein [Hyphopichia burtonii NRRL Y-1933]ODV68570.1 Pkinase-domain-containing protein [Hyphopichia burtonii NRRL Y-1933]